MSDDQNQRFKYLNNQDPDEGSNIKPMNDKNKLNNFASNQDFSLYMGNQVQKDRQSSQIKNAKGQNQQISQEQKQRDRQIRKLTNINKHLLQQLKDQNDELTKKVNKQRFRIPRKSIIKSPPKGQEGSKQLQALKRQLQNAYKQIEFYKSTISLLRAKQTPLDEQDKINETFSRLKQKNDQIQKLQQQLKTQKAIKHKQNKQLGKVQNESFIDLIKKLDDQISSAKVKLKEVKKNYGKRQQLQKKQHMYLSQIQLLIKRSKLEEQKVQQSNLYASAGDKMLANQEQQISQANWKSIKQKLLQQKKKYEQYGKKLTYQNYLKSKQAKLAQEIELKYKQKAKTFQKLTSKLHEVNKLARLKPRPQILQRVDLKMQRLKDIISRQNTMQLANVNKIKIRVQSEDVRQFKKWQIEHASRQNSQINAQFSQQNTNNKQSSDYQDNEQQSGYFIMNKKNSHSEVS